MDTEQAEANRTELFLGGEMGVGRGDSVRELVMAGVLVPDCVFVGVCVGGTKQPAST